MDKDELIAKLRKLLSEQNIEMENLEDQLLEARMATEELLKQIVTELQAIKVALLGQKPATGQPANSTNASSGNGGGKYAKRPDEDFATCNRCGANNVVWRESKAGKSYLINANGEYHSKTCSGVR